MFENWWHKKEKPLAGLLGMGGGIQLGSWSAGSYDDNGHQASGGLVSDWEHGGSVYRTHIFYGPGTFTISSLSSYYPANVEYLVVGGGGGGGYEGGGGAGGMRTNVPGDTPGGPGGSTEAAYPVSATSYPVTVGRAGIGMHHGNSQEAGPGTFSQFGSPTQTNIRSEGGGGGVAGNPPGAGGHRGGSGGAGYSNSGSPSGIGAGGAGNYTASPHSGGSPVPTQGYPGGGAAGGGGGAGATGSSGFGAAGGNGLRSLINGPTAVSFGGPGPAGTGYFAGGGSGGPSGPTAEPGPYNPGGHGGGGYGQNQRMLVPQNSGLHGTGSGGGGSWNDSGAPGGTGVVAIKYKIGETSLSTKATGGLVSYDKNNKRYIHTFTHPGTFTNPEALTVNMLMIGGGGGGGTDNGGGGGAGEIIVGTDYSIPASPTGRSIVIGAGGLGGRSDLDDQAAGLNGTATEFNSLTARAGGGGAAGSQASPTPTASPTVANGGGGSGVTNISGGQGSAPVGNTPTLTYYGGISGGTGTGTSYFNSGGGASGVTNGVPGWTNTYPTTSGNGAVGLENSILGSPYYWGAGGGGGQWYDPANNIMNGGRGGGGGGSTGPGGSMPVGTAGADAIHGGWPGLTLPTTPGGAGNGVDGTGSGGGGDGRTSGCYGGGNGGSGIVIISYAE